MRSLTRNSAQAAASVSQLSGEVTKLTKSVQQDLGKLSTAASSSATSVGAAATQLGLTAAQVNGLLSENRSSLVTTLNSIDQTSRQVQDLVGSLSPQIKDGAIVQNLETLSANAAAASTNLRNLTDTVGSSDNMLMLQQTLDSARATFQNAQKITADLDELTGDPELRRHLRDLINGFSKLVSSSQQLQRQAAIAQALTQAPSEASSVPLEASPSPADVALNPDGLKPSELQLDRLMTSRSDLRLPTDAEYETWLKTFAPDSQASPEPK